MRVLRFAGIAAFVSFFLTASISISVNPWFVFTRHAFSSLGSDEAVHPWIYNAGMIWIGAFVALYAVTFLIDSMNRVESFGAGLVFVAGVFLLLIGIFHDGTRPHNFVSAYFFGQAEAALVVSGIGLVLNDVIREKRAGWIIVAFSAGAFAVALMYDWPSSAAVEEYGIFTIGVRVVLLTKIQMKRLNIG